MPGRISQIKYLTFPFQHTKRLRKRTNINVYAYQFEGKAFHRSFMSISVHFAVSMINVRLSRRGPNKTLTTSVICDFITVYSLSQQGVLYDVYSHIFLLAA